MFKKIFSHINYLFYIIPTIYINLKYLPLKQAVKLPIWVIKPHFYNLKGKIILDTTHISCGMIKLGVLCALSYPDTGIRLNLQGGTIVFKGKCRIGSNSVIEVGKHGKLIFGNNIIASTTLRIFCYKNIHIDDNNRFGWDVILMDTNFHPLKDLNTGQKKCATKEIYIGKNNWFGSRTVCMPGTKTLNHCIFGLGAIINKNASLESYAVHIGTPCTPITRNVYRDLNDDRDEYQ